MLILKENHRVYLVQSTYAYSLEGFPEPALVPENMPIFKAYQSKALIGGTDIATLEALRYRRLPFPQEFTAVNLLRKTVPQIERALEELGRLDESDEIDGLLLLAKGEKAFMVLADFTVREIQKEEAVGWAEDRLRYALTLTDGMPLIPRARAAYKIVGEILGVNPFPLIMMDATGFALKIIEEEKE